jgi:hypothetical protein
MFSSSVAAAPDHHAADFVSGIGGGEDVEWSGGNHSGGERGVFQKSAPSQFGVHAIICRSSGESAWS